MAMCCVQGGKANIEHVKIVAIFAYAPGKNLRRSELNDYASYFQHSNSVNHSIGTNGIFTVVVGKVYARLLRVKRELR